VRQVGHRMQRGAFLGEHLHRAPTGAAVHPGINIGDERCACRFDLGEAGVLGQQVRLGGHDSGLASLTAFSTPPLDAGSAGSQVSTEMP
jgi:hypothetical protein